MRISKALVIVSVVLLAVVTIASVLAYRTAKWALGRMHPSYGATLSMHSGSVSGKLISSGFSTSFDPPVRVRSDGMAQAFRSGKLPAPLPMPSRNPEDAAADLAKRVMAADDQSTPALLTAVQMSGFSIRSEDGSISVESVKPGQGIIFDAWEVAATAKLFCNGMQMKLVDLGNALADTLPAFKGAPISALILEGLRNAAQSSQDSKRFWAHFMAELGRQSEHPYDLLAQDLNPADVNLDAIQVSFILRRLAVDLMILNQTTRKNARQKTGEDVETGEGLISPKLVRFGDELQTTPRLIDAAWREPQPHLIRVQEGEGANSSLPCTLAELAAQIMDASAYLSGFGFDNLTEYLKEHGMEGAGKYGKATQIINALLAVIKLIAYYACLDTDITMSGSPPLVRTQSIYQAGERRTLTASVRENLGKWQALNCVRIALNGAGIDFSLPNDGPQAGIGIQWVLVGGGVSINHDTHEITWPFVELVSPDGTPRLQTAMGPTSNATAPKTDEQGHATVDIEGLKQKEDLGPNPQRVMKEAVVRFTCEPKPISMTQDMIDAVGNYLAGPVGLIVGGPVEILLRSKIHFSKPLVIPVVDWQPCNGGWSGTITYSTTFTHHETSAYPGYTVTYDTHDSNTIEAHLHGSESSGAWAGPSHATVSANGERRETDISSVGTCERTDTLSGSMDTDVAINALGDNQFYVAGVSEIHVSGEHRESGTCNLSKASGAIWSLPAFKATADPSNPEVLQGSSELTDEEWPGRVAKITWNLRTCGR